MYFLIKCTYILWYIDMFGVIYDFQWIFIKIEKVLPPELEWNRSAHIEPYNRMVFYTPAKVSKSTLHSLLLIFPYIHQQLL